MPHTRTDLILLAMLALVGVLTGCGGGGGGGGGGGVPAMVVVEGSVPNAAPGTMVEAYTFNYNGLADRFLLVPTGVTGVDPAGRWTLQVSTGNPVLFMTAGGGLTDSATGTSESFTSGPPPDFIFRDHARRLIALRGSGTDVSSFTMSLLTNIATHRLLAEEATKNAASPDLSGARVSLALSEVAREFGLVDAAGTGIDPRIAESHDPANATFATRLRAAPKSKEARQGLIQAALFALARSFGAGPVETSDAITADLRDGRVDGVGYRVGPFNPSGPLDHSEFVPIASTTLRETSGSADLEVQLIAFLAGPLNRSGLRDVDLPTLRDLIRTTELAPPINLTPRCDPIADMMVFEDALTISIAVTGITAGSASEDMTQTILCGGGGFPGLFSTRVTGTGSARVLELNLESDFVGDIDCEFTVGDDGTRVGGASPKFLRRFRLTVLPVNDPPTITRPSPPVLISNGTSTRIEFTNVTSGPSDESGQTLSFDIRPSNPDLFRSLVVTESGTSRFVDLRPVGGAFGFATLDYIVRDDGGNANGGSDFTVGSLTIRVETPVISSPVPTVVSVFPQASSTRFTVSVEGFQRLLDSQSELRLNNVPLDPANVTAEGRVAEFFLPQGMPTGAATLAITSGSQTATRQVEVLAPPTATELAVNEILANPGTSLDANRDGVFDAEEDEFVELVNVSGRPIDIGNLFLLVDGTARHRLRAPTFLPPGAGVVIFAGSQPQGFAPAVYGAATRSAIARVSAGGFLGLNDSGGTIQLQLGGSADTVYSGAVAGQSLNRQVDGDGNASFVPHSSAETAPGAANATGLASPGVKVDGSGF